MTPREKALKELSDWMSIELQRLEGQDWHSTIARWLKNVENTPVAKCAGLLDRSDIIVVLPEVLRRIIRPEELQVDDGKSVTELVTFNFRITRKK